MQPCLGMIADKGRALLIVVNKWDGLDDYQKSEVKRKLDVNSLSLVMPPFTSFQRFMALVLENYLNRSKGLMSMQEKDTQHHF